MDDPQHFSIILLCLLFSAFFSGMEIAFFSADKLRVELLRKKGAYIGRILAFFQKNQSHFIATILVGNNLALVVYGIFMAQLIEPWLVNALPDLFNGDIVVLIFQTLIATFIVLLSAEFLPKSIFLLNPDFLLQLFAVPMAMLYYLMYPVVLVIEQLSKLIIVGVLKMPYSEDRTVFGITDLNEFIKKNTEEKDDESEVDAKIFSNAVEFKEIKVRECMVPRTELVAVDIEATIENLEFAFNDSGHSKILVYKDSIDDVVGYCHSIEMFRKPESIKKILSPIKIVPETVLANELLIQLINEHRSIALVVDEFGGTSGIVTIEDVIEEIFGDIKDEHDDEQYHEERISDREFVLSARLEVDYLNEKYKWGIPEGDYDTLGGYILNHNENIPKQDDIIEIDAFVIQVLVTEENRIDQVKLTIPMKPLVD
ncbi:MAG: HlyC/CorC family transporter [Cyclobacteriaceae bacterium]